MGTPGLWIGFNTCVLGLLALDLFVFNRHAHAVTLREAALWSAFWVGLSLGFGYWILRSHGTTPALEFYTGYLVEKSLSVDNIFIFLLVFRAFAIEARFQHRVLFWGVFGALILRGLLIAAGAALLQRFEWTLLLFGAFLLYAGLHVLIRGHRDFKPENNALLRWARRVLPVTQNLRGERFFVKDAGRWMVTPLLLALMVMESTDLIFALDSVPAVFGITRDPFLVYTSNVCAILGLRAFYFLLVGALPLFRYLDAGVSSVLIFIGAKMLAAPWIAISTPVSLAVVGFLLGTAVVASMVAARGAKPEGS